MPFDRFAELVFDRLCQINHLQILCSAHKDGREDEPLGASREKAKAFIPRFIDVGDKGFVSFYATCVEKPSSRSPLTHAGDSSPSPEVLSSNHDPSNGEFAPRSHDARFIETPADALILPVVTATSSHTTTLHPTIGTKYSRASKN